MPSGHQVHRGRTALVLAAALLATALLAALAATASAGLLGIGIDYNLYDLNTLTGAATNPRFVGNKVNSIAMSPAGTLYGVSQGEPADVPPGGNLYTINVTTGAPTYVATLGTYIYTEGDIAFDPTTGILYAVEGPGALFTINTSNGVGTAIGNIGTTLDLSAMTFDAAGNLYVVDSFGPTLLKVNKATAAIVATVPLDPIGQQVGGLAFDPNNGTLYHVADTSSQLYTLNTTTGSAVTIGANSVPGGIWGLAWQPDPTPSRTSSWGRVKRLYR